MEDTAVIILAAGKGKRMGSDLPKALIPLGGTPFISWVLRAIEDGLGIKSHIVVGQGREQVMEYLGENYEYIVQTEQLGTGHAVHSAKNTLLAKNIKTVLVLYADQPLMRGESIRALIARHHENNTPVTMATVLLPDYEGMWLNFINFGRVMRSNDNTIVKIIEARDATEKERAITEVSPSYFVFSADWLWSRLPMIKNENSSGEYYLTDLVGLACNEGITIGNITIDPIEALGANTQEELAVLEQVISGKTK